MGRKNLPHHMRAMTKSSGKVYYYYAAPGRGGKLTPLGCDYVTAVQKWAELMEEEAPPPAITFKDVADRYIIEVLPGKAPRTQKDNLKELDNLLIRFASAPLEAIEPHHVKQYLRLRSQKRTAMVYDKRLGREVEKTVGAETRANREKALLSHIWNFARSSGITSLPNPCTGVKGFTESGRDYYAEDDVFEAVKLAASQPVRDAMDLAYLTGQRPADVLKLSETDIGKDSTLTVVQNKRGGRVRLRLALTGKDGTPNDLGEAVQRILESKREHKVRALQLICNEKGGALTYSALDNRFEDARRKASDQALAEGNDALAAAILKFQFRDLRAKAGTDKADSTNLDQAKRQLGHSNIKTTEIYVRARKGEKVSPTK